MSEGAELMEKWGKNGQTSKGWYSHGDVGCSEQTGHLVGLQGCRSATYFLMEGPDTGYIVVNATCQREMVSEVIDVQAQSGDI